MTTPPDSNGHRPDETVGLDIEQERARVQAGIQSAVAMETGQQGGLRQDILLEMAKASIKPEEWMHRTYYRDEREIAIAALDERRRNRGRFGWSNPDLVDWHQALMRNSLNGRTVNMLAEMYMAEKRRMSPEPRESMYERSNGSMNTGGGNLKG